MTMDSSGSSVSVTIAKADPTYTAPTAVTGLSYDTNPKTLVNAGSALGGTMEYRVGTSGNFETSLPTAVEAGTYTVYWQVVGDGNHNTYIGSPINVTIGAMTVGSVTITLGTSSYTYDGSAKTPSVTVRDGSTIIPSNEYTVDYSNNVNAGTATVTITGKVGGNYDVNGSTTFTINPKTVTNPTITLSQTNYTYDGSECKPNVTSVVDADTKTTIPTNEYTVSYSNNKNAGTATVSFGADIEMFAGRCA